MKQGIAHVTLRRGIIPVSDNDVGTYIKANEVIDILKSIEKGEYSASEYKQVITDIIIKNS